MSRLLRTVTILVAATALAPVRAQSPFTGISGIIENYIIRDAGSNRINHRASWAWFQAQLSESTKLVGSALVYGEGGHVGNAVDEGYLQYSRPGITASVGRMQSGFGFGDWSETWYYPVVSFPIMRFMPMAGDLALQRYDTGVHAEIGSGKLQAMVGVVDVVNTDWQLAPRKLDHAVARVQASVGDAIIGFNGVTKPAGGEASLLGIDLRYTQRHFQIRGEYARGVGGGLVSDGFYVDFIHRPAWSYRTQFGLRLEQYEMYGLGPKARLASLGIRQIVTPWLTLFLNYATGNTVAPADGMRGWRTQVLTAFKF